MRVSLSITNFTWPTGPERIATELGAIVRAADAGGLDTVWVADHLLQADPSSSLDAEMLEAYTTLGYLAARTQRVRLGSLVTPVTFRAPALLVKSVTTLDVLSGGRAWMGIGTGYNEAEAAMMGVHLPPVAERFERLEETLQVAQRMWSGDASPFEGRHTRLESPIGAPAPLSAPHPPVLVGGMGERKTLRLVARYADACNLFDIPDGGATIRHKLDVLAQHCEEAGRPYGDIEKTVSSRLAPGETAEQFAERCHALAELGLDHVILVGNGAWRVEDVELAGLAAGAIVEV